MSDLNDDRPQLTAAELVQHPEFQHVTWNLRPTKAGKATVAEGRGGPLDIAYEVHGHGPIRLVVCFSLAFKQYIPAVSIIVVRPEL
jgi:hypothetical protein